MNKNNKFIKTLKKGGAMYLLYKIMDSTFYWTKMPDGKYENIYLVMELNDPISEKIMKGLLKLRDYAKTITKD